MGCAISLNIHKINPCSMEKEKLNQQEKRLPSSKDSLDNVF